MGLRPGLRCLAAQIARGFRLAPYWTDSSVNGGGSSHSSVIAMVPPRAGQEKVRSHEGLTQPHAQHA